MNYYKIIFPILLDLLFIYIYYRKKHPFLLVIIIFLTLFTINHFVIILLNMDRIKCIKDR